MSKKSPWASSLSGHIGPGVSQLGFKTTELVRGFQNFILIFLSVGIVALYSSYRRPIWTDEILHFLWGANPLGLEIIQEIVTSTKGVNHGQTGVYIFTDALLLHAFGASEMVLRLPSLLSGIYLLLAAAYFMRVKNLHFGWQVLTIFTVGSLSYLMYFVGEARPYFPLAAATVGTLTYYAIPLNRRNRRTTQFIGWSAITLGVTMHPYFALYWGALSLTSYLFCLTSVRKISLREFWRFLNPALFIWGMSVYLVIGFSTWLTGQPEFDRNPFEFQFRENLFSIVMDSHFNFLGLSFIVLPNLLVLMAFFALWALGSSPSSIAALNLAQPVLLVAVSIGLTTTLIAVSYISDYWILSRQWLASMALIPIAYVWFCGLVSQRSDLRNSFVSSLIFVLASLPVLMAFINRVDVQRARLNEYRKAFDQITIPEDANTADGQRRIFADLGLEAANVNIKAGGKVWHVFEQ